MSRRITCPACGNGAVRGGEEIGSGVLTIHQTAVLSAEYQAHEPGGPYMAPAQFADQGHRRWINCDDCGHHWPTTRPEVSLAIW